MLNQGPRAFSSMEKVTPNAFKIETNWTGFVHNFFISLTTLPKHCIELLSKISIWVAITWMSRTGARFQGFFFSNIMFYFGLIPLGTRAPGTRLAIVIIHLLAPINTGYALYKLCPSIQISPPHTHTSMSCDYRAWWWPGTVSNQGIRIKDKSRIHSDNFTKLETYFFLRCKYSPMSLGHGKITITMIFSEMQIFTHVLRTWKNNYNHDFFWDANIHPCPNVNALEVGAWVS